MARTQGESGPPKAIIAKQFFAAEIGRIPFQLSRKILARLLFQQNSAYSGFSQPIAQEHNTFVYPYEGEIEIGNVDQSRPLEAQKAGVLSAGDCIEIRSVDQPAAFLLLAGRPLRESVVQHGPFVMNTREEIDRTLSDYRYGQLV